MQESMINHQHQSINSRQLTFLALLLLLLAISLLLLFFGGYAFDKTQVRILPTEESILDSSSQHSGSNAASDLIGRDSISLIFLTFYYGMSRVKFQSEIEHLLSVGELSKSNDEAIFEPLEGAKFNLSFNHPLWRGEDKLNRVCLKSGLTTEKTQKDLISIYKEKYGNQYIEEHSSRLAGPDYVGNDIYALTSESVTYTWELNDGRNIEIEIFASTRAYKGRDIPKVKAFAFEMIHADGKLKPDEWIKLEPQETKRSSEITYYSKENIEDSKRRKIKEASIKSEQEKRIQKNKNRI